MVRITGDDIEEVDEVEDEIRARIHDFVNQNRTTESLLQRVFGDVSQQSVGRQIAIGGASGWCAGYLFGRVGKVAAAALGTSLLLLQIAQHNDFIHVNWPRLRESLDSARRQLGSEAERQLPGMIEQMQTFFRHNMYVAGGFAGGFLLGLSS